ncbi:MAG: cytidine deaminase [Acidobacteria bacterium]|nr:cytidine deaminase [Acidobacteriota bacterium]
MSPRKASKTGSRLAREQRDLLLASAKNALHHAYAPYSGFHVGAAVLTEKGETYTGCNVENASYGLTNCAERTAICNAVAAEGACMRLRAVAVWSRPERPCAPCGACRQVILEFGPEAMVFYQDRKGVAETQAQDLLPAGFRL